MEGYSHDTSPEDSPEGFRIKRPQINYTYEQQLAHKWKKSSSRPNSHWLDHIESIKGSRVICSMSFGCFGSKAEAKLPNSALHQFPSCLYCFFPSLTEAFPLRISPGKGRRMGSILSLILRKSSHIVRTHPSLYTQEFHKIPINRLSIYLYLCEHKYTRYGRLREFPSRFPSPSTNCGNWTCVWNLRLELWAFSKMWLWSLTYSFLYINSRDGNFIIYFTFILTSKILNQLSPIAGKHNKRNRELISAWENTGNKSSFFGDFTPEKQLSLKFQAKFSGIICRIICALPMKRGSLSIPLTETLQKHCWVLLFQDFEGCR